MPNQAPAILARPPITSDSSSEQSDPAQKDVMMTWVRSNPALPTLPTIALQVIETAGKSDCDLADLANIVSQDPVLCGKVLRTVNSALYALRNPVTSITGA